MSMNIRPNRKITTAAAKDSSIYITRKRDKDADSYTPRRNGQTSGLMLGCTP